MKHFGRYLKRGKSYTYVYVEILIKTPIIFDTNIDIFITNEEN